MRGSSSTRHDLLNLRRKERLLPQKWIVHGEPEDSREDEQDVNA
jgi:hypothetical protein